MKTSQIQTKNRDLTSLDLKSLSEIDPQIVMLFASNDTFENEAFMSSLKENVPGAQWVGCSTAGEVSPDGVNDNTTVVTALHFDSGETRFRTATADVEQSGGSEGAGKKLGESLKADDLSSIILLSPGIDVNGSALVKGLTDVVGKNVVITGGLAGDGGKFEKTYTLSPEGVNSRMVVAVGFYGSNLEMRHGCMGGWDPFGKVRKVTKAVDNVLFELDGERALDVYKEYLGEHAKDLPASGLLFPFALLNDDSSESGLIRTILGIDEEAGSLTMAGDIPNDSLVRLMHANTKGLVSGAEKAAAGAAPEKLAENAFALIVSCVGRKLVMGPGVDEEIEVIADTFGDGCALTGFYSYGEISPFIDEVDCKLHNQTMTISYLYEKDENK